MQTHYDVLGEEPDASESDLESAYHCRAQILHPDHHTGTSADVRAEAEELMRELNDAWAVLENPLLRSRDDESLRQAETRGRAAPPTATSRPGRERQAPPIRPTGRRTTGRRGQIAVISMIAATSLTSLLLLLSFAWG